ncbi:MAG TPA: DNA recombination protein RmuC [Stellaceae bacterium]|nr:DNA recombination protein RmuC [Stellaceae bacterium]
MATYALLAFAVLNAVLLVLLLRRVASRGGGAGAAADGRFDAIDRNAESLRRDLVLLDQGLRAEIGNGVRDGLAAAFDKVQAGTRAQAEQLGAFGRDHAARLGDMQAAITQFGSNVGAALEGMRRDVADRLDTRLGQLTERIDAGFNGFSQSLREQQEQLRDRVEKKLDDIRTGNESKLEQMRLTVDEKLQSTLEQRLGASFKQVSDSLEQVYRSVGEMQALATGVGDLKRVLTNVKARGTWTEIGLETMLAEVLAPDQYGRNVEIRPGSNQRVEFAIRLPGDETAPVWLPLDVKFPTADYERLTEAAERGEQAEVEQAGRAIELRVRESARDICSKYVHPPHSTDFAVMYLPTEGLFAEVVRRPGLIDAMQRDCHVMIAGPTTLFTLLTAMRMGFRSLAIQKRSAEVWKVLGAVKSEFSKFGDFVDKVGKKLGEAQKVIDDNLGTRRRAMERQLRRVEALPEAEALSLLELDRMQPFLDGDDEERAAAE